MIYSKLNRGRWQFTVPLFAVFITFIAGCESTTDIEHLAKAQAFEQSGDARSATIEYKNALKLNANFAEARFGLGKIYLNQGAVDNAEKELRLVYSAGYQTDETATLLAQALIHSSKFKEVLDDVPFDTIQTPALKAQVLSYHGLAHLGLRDLDAAAAAFEKALSEMPGSEYALYGQASWFFLQGKHAEALSKAKQARDKNTAFRDAFLLLGDIHYALAEYDDAEREYTKAITTAQGQPLNSLSLKANFGVVQSRLSQSNYDAALEKIEYLLQSAPNHPLPKYFRAVVAHQNKDYVIAEENLIQVLAISPGYKPSLLLLGAVNFAQGQLEQAEDYLSKYLAADPTHMPARQLLASIRMKLNQPGLALETLTPALNDAMVDVSTLIMAGSAAVRSGELQVGTRYLKKALVQAPENSAVRTELALAYLAESDAAKAIKELKRAALDTDTAPGRRAAVLLVLTHLKENDAKQALKAAKKFKKEYAEGVLADNLLGIVYSFNGEETKARQHFEASLAINPTYTSANINLARLDQRAGNLKSAGQRYESVLLTEPKNAVVMLALAGIAEQSKDREQFVHWLKQADTAAPKAIEPKLMLARYYIATGDIDVAEGKLKEASAIAENAPAVLAMQGLLQLLKKDNKGARSSFEKLVQNDPSSVVGHYQLALLQVRSNELSKAKRSLERVLKLNPKHLLATTLLARVNMQDGGLSKAQKTVDNIKSSQPGSVLAYTLEADLMMAQERYSDAVILYDKASEQQGNVTLAIKTAKAYRQMGHGDKAIDVLLAWLKEHENSYPARLNLAGEYDLNNQRAKAIDQYEILLKQYPQDMVTLNNLAWLYSLVGDERAIQLAKRAYDLSPDNPLILDTYGWILVENGNLEQGSGLLKDAFSLANDVADIQYHYAVSLAKLGNAGKAKRLLQKLIDKPEGLTVDLDKAKSLLKQL